VGARLDAELISEQHPEAFIGAQSLRDVALPLECLHENAMAGLTVWSELYELASAALGLRQGRPTQFEPRRRQALEPAQPDILEASSPLVEPGNIVTLQQRTTGDVVRDAGRTPGLGLLAARHMRLRAMDALEGGLDVDERITGQHELDLRPSRQHL
jgi:hypothetical protein